MLLYSWLTLLKKNRAIAVIRASKIELGRKMALAAARGGMELIEITWNSPRSAELISQLRVQLPNCIIGTGTLMNQTQVKEAIVAGAQFLFAPHVDPLMIKAAKDSGLPIIPGALTPTEIITAWQWGATCVKVFPVQPVGGPNYIRSLQGPLSQIPLIPCGGITLEDAEEFLAAGATAVGVGTQLFPKHLVASGNWEAISDKAAWLRERLGQPSGAQPSSTNSLANSSANLPVSSSANLSMKPPVNSSANLHVNSPVNLQV